MGTGIPMRNGLGQRGIAKPDLPKTQVLHEDVRRDLGSDVLALLCAKEKGPARCAIF